MITDILSYLQNIFGNQVGAITRAQFRKFMGFSQSTDVRLAASGQYPRCILGQRILLIDLAKWLEDIEEKENAEQQCECAVTPKKRGRPKLKLKNFFKSTQINPNQINSN